MPHHDWALLELFLGEASGQGRAEMRRGSLLGQELVRFFRAGGQARDLFRLYNSVLTNLDQPLPHGRILALDVGKKRIGLAVSDELGITAQGIETLRRTRIREDLEQLREIALRWNVQTLLVGRPLHMSGTESRQSDYTQEFADRLRRHLRLPLVFWDERLTSAEAERMLRDGGATLEQKKNAVDRLAAALLLQSYLGFQQTANRPEEGESLG